MNGHFCYISQNIDMMGFKIKYCSVLNCQTVTIHSDFIAKKDSQMCMLVSSHLQNPFQVGHVTEQHQNTSLDQDDERAGFDLGATGRLALMAKLAEGTGMKVPEQARQALYGVQEPVSR